MVRSCTCTSVVSHVFIDLDNTLYINDRVAEDMIEKIQSKHIIERIKLMRC